MTNHSLEVPPGEGFRFALGSKGGLKSTINRIWSSKNSADIYVGAIPTLSEIKVSFHESGQFQHSFNSVVAMNYVDRNADRHMEKWSRPLPFVKGLTRAYFVRVPRTELRVINVDVEGVRWAEDPGPGYWVNFEIVLADPEVRTVLNWDQGIHIGTLRLADGGAVVVFAHRYRPRPEDGQLLASYRNSMWREDFAGQFAALESPVLGLFSNSEDGARGVTQLSMSEPPSEIRVICTGDPVYANVRSDIRWRRRSET